MNKINNISLEIQCVITLASRLDWNVKSSLENKAQASSPTVGWKEKKAEKEKYVDSIRTIRWRKTWLRLVFPLHLSAIEEAKKRRRDEITDTYRGSKEESKTHFFILCTLFSIRLAFLKVRLYPIYVRKEKVKYYIYLNYIHTLDKELRRTDRNFKIIK